MLELLQAVGGADQLRALGLTASGQPRHPLYAPGVGALQPLVLAQSRQPAAF
ncbi:hypothetical protein [Cyanobium sp. ATX-6F1]|uniref:hypothetical protein n=1 Tax=Cyanobium sp. ATX-6F1 TaxID=3137388 RepID=UPI0039BEB01F